MIEIIQILLLSSAFLPGLFLRVSSSVPASQFEKLVSIQNFFCTLEYHIYISDQVAYSFSKFWSLVLLLDSVTIINFDTF